MGCLWSYPGQNADCFFSNRVEQHQLTLRPVSADAAPRTLGAASLLAYPADALHTAAFAASEFACTSASGAGFRADTRRRLRGAGLGLNRT